MDNIKDLLLGKDYTEPPEIKAIKKFVHRQFDADVTVSINQKQIIINVPGAALASTLQMHITELQHAVATDKKLVIRIN